LLDFDHTPVCPIAWPSGKLQAPRPNIIVASDALGGQFDGRRAANLMGKRLLASGSRNLRLRSAMSVTPLQVYKRLYDAYGPQQWWPGESPLEVMLGAVLVQNTAWRNVEKAIENLRDADLLHLERLHAAPHEELAELIRPAGYYQLKARRLKNLLKFVVEEYGSLEAMFATDVATLRDELLSINGIGPETADSILLYAGGLPTFVVDTYTARMLMRHGWIEPEAGYHEIKEHFESQLPLDVQLFNEYHALIVRVGHHHCRRTPNCQACPLAPLLPPDGIQQE
jgi:endonuclease-3 related protein